MHSASGPTPDALSTADLASRLAALVGEERQTQVDFLLHLEAFDRRRAWLTEGYGSLWAYCAEVLHLREGPAGRRIAAMRVLRQFPGLEAPLRDGRLCLSTVTLLGQVLTEENLDAMVAQAAFRSKEETERLVAALQPRNAPQQGIRLLPAFRGDDSRDAAAAGSAPVPPATATSDLPLGVAAPMAAPSPSKPPRLRPLDGARYSLTVTLAPEAKADLDRLIDLLSHKTGRDLGAVVHEAIRCALEKHGKRRGVVAPSRARSSRKEDAARSSDPRAIPMAVRRAVHARDGGRCTYVAPGGRRCDSRWKLELHHRDPAARGGPPTTANLCLRCRPHNLLEAERDFGAAHVRRFTAREPPAGEAVAGYGPVARLLAMGPAP